MPFSPSVNFFFRSVESQGSSLVERIHLPTQETWVWSLIRKEPTCCRATKPLCCNHWACALKPESHNYWAHQAATTETCMPQSPCSTKRKATPMSSLSTSTREQQLQWPKFTATREKPGEWHPTPVLLAWKIPWMEEPGRLQPMGSLRVGQDWATSLSLFIFMHWRRKWQPTPVSLPGESQGRGSLVGCRLWDTPVSLPGESQGRGSLVGCCLWDHTESDTSEVT